MRRKTVMILGCGPAGLFAAQAARDRGHPVAIFSKRRKSQMFGAQYLHEEIPNLFARSFTINYRLEGTALGYAAKVYGPERAEEMCAKVSPARLLGLHKAWDIREAYGRAWDIFEPFIVDTEVTPEWLKAAVGKGREYSLVVSSIPAQTLCVPETLGRDRAHSFISSQIWAIGDAPERGIRCPLSSPLNTVICNGDPSPGWYRASNVNGMCSAEWPYSRRPPFDHVAAVSKPVSTSCDCWQYRGDLPVNLLRVGRYGTHTKGVLSHHAYRDTREALA